MECSWGYDGWAATNDKVALGISEDTLFVVYTGTESGPKTFRCLINPFGSNIPGPLRVTYIPSWNFGHANAVTTDPKLLFVFCYVKDGESKGAVYLTDATEDGKFNDPINLGLKVEAYTNKTPTAMVVPGLPGNVFPWRVWLHSKGKGDDKSIHEHTFSI
jgi:hypothetical protein